MSSRPRSAARFWSIERKAFFGLVLILISGVLSGWYTIVSTREANRENNRVMDLHGRALINAEQLRYYFQLKTSQGRAYLHSGDQAMFLPEINRARAQFKRTLQALRDQVIPSNDPQHPTLPIMPAKARLLDRIEALESTVGERMQAAYRMREQQTPNARLLAYLRENVMPLRIRLESSLDELVHFENYHLDGARRVSDRTEKRIQTTLMLVEISLTVLVLGLGGFILRIIREGNRLHEETKRAVRSREEVLAVVSHDLKNPLSSIDLCAQLLLREDSTGLARKSGETIRKSVSTMMALIQNLLDQAQLESGKMIFETGDHCASELLADARDMFEPLAVRKSLRLEIAPCDPGLAFRGDRARTAQVLSNLIGNAIKFTPEGGRVSLEAGADGRAVAFTVRDTGVGISPDRLSHVFDRFWQARETARLGSGLGLAIVKGLVEAQGGSISVASQAGRGSAFSFRLPAAESRAQNAAPMRRELGEAGDLGSTVSS
jgi:signal transduction histidine kinase